MDEPCLTALRAGLVGCRDCGHVSTMGTARCPRCGASLKPPDRRRLQQVWALMIAGIVAYIPANLYPMLYTTTLGRREGSTIIGGVIDLAHHGSWFVAAVVFTASVVIPISKFCAIGFIAWSVRRGASRGPKRRLKLHHLVELVGRWSMIDVFVVAVLAALIQLGFLARIDPGPAAAPFALSVALTMIAASRLDPRLIWED